MVEFKMTWMTPSGTVRTDFGRAKIEKIKEWQEAVRKAVAEDDEVTSISVPTYSDSDFSGGDMVRAIMIKEIGPKYTRPADWS
jgi:hypothetical protein